MNSSYILANDIRMRYLHWNLGEGEQPVLLLHGLASNARIWERVAPLLAGAGLMPIAPDLRGHGLTDKPDGDYGFDTFTHDLAAFVDGCNLEKPLVVGHSWGAMLALDFAAHFSFGPRAPAGVILVDGGITQLDQAPGATWESTRDRLTPPSLVGLPVEEFINRVRANPKWQPDDEAISIILGNFDVDEDETIAPYLSFEHHMQIVRAMWDFKTYDCFARLRCPVLAIPAEMPQPWSAPEKAFMELKKQGIARIQEQRPDFQVEWMQDSIHDIPLQYPDRLAAAIIQFTAGLHGKTVGGRNGWRSI